MKTKQRKRNCGTLVTPGSSQMMSRNARRKARGTAKIVMEVGKRPTGHVGRLVITRPSGKTTVTVWLALRSQSKEKRDLKLAQMAAEASSRIRADKVELVGPVVVKDPDGPGVTRNSAKKRNKSKVRIKAEHPGKLGGPGYLSRPEAKRRAILRSCVKKHGYSSCVGSLVAMRVWGKNSLDATQKRKLQRDEAYVHKTFRAKATRNGALPKIPSRRALGLCMQSMNDMAGRA